MIPIVRIVLPAIVVVASINDGTNSCSNSTGGGSGRNNRAHVYDTTHRKTVVGTVVQNSFCFGKLFLFSPRFYRRKLRFSSWGFTQQQKHGGFILQMAQTNDHQKIAKHAMCFSSVGVVYHYGISHWFQREAASRRSVSINQTYLEAVYYCGSHFTNHNHFESLLTIISKDL